MFEIAHPGHALKTKCAKQLPELRTHLLLLQQKSKACICVIKLEASRLGV